MTGKLVAEAVKVVFFAIICSVLPVQYVLASSNPIYNDGDTYVELRDAEELKGARPPFSHPYIIQPDKLEKILSSLSFREKGLFVKKGGKKVFNTEEVKTLVPLITDALSKSKADEYLYVHSTRERSLFSDLETVFSVFVTNEDLNIAFSRIQARTDNVPRSGGGKRSSSPRDPTSMKGSGFWELALGAGHSYQSGHRNWLVINMQEKSFEAGPSVSLVEKEVEFEPPHTYNPGLEERLKKIEERLGLRSSGSPPPEMGYALPQKLPPEEENLSQKFRDLKELLDNDLISPEDYRYKKAELLKRESLTKKSIPQRLKDLMRLRDEGLITDQDYEKKKRELLDRL